MRYPVEIVAAIALSWLARDAAGHDVAAAPSAPADPPIAAVAPATIGPAFDDDAAMAKAADPVASYTLHASLDPVKHVVEGKGTITWRNASRTPQGEVWLHLYLNAFKNERTYFMRFPGVDGFRGAGTPGDWGHVDVKRFAIEGGADLWPGADKTSPGDPDDETDIRVPLPEPVQPGATVRFDVAFEAHLPQLLFRTGYVGGFHMVGQWFPKLARLEPDGRWAHFPFHHLSEFYADFGTYDVTVDTPDDVIVGATGQLEGEVRRRRARGAALRPGERARLRVRGVERVPRAHRRRRGGRRPPRALPARLRPRRRGRARRRAVRPDAPRPRVRALPVQDAHDDPPAARRRGGRGAWSTRR